MRRPARMWWSVSALSLACWLSGDARCPAQFGPVSMGSRGVSNFAATLDPTTHTPPQYARNVARANVVISPPGMAANSVVGGMLATHATANVFRGRHPDTPAPGSSSPPGGTRRRGTVVGPRLGNSVAGIPVSTPTLRQITSGHRRTPTLRQITAPSGRPLRLGQVRRTR